MIPYLYTLILIVVILIIYKYRKKIRLNDVLLASIVIVIGCSLYKSRRIEGLCLNIDDSATNQSVSCNTSDDRPPESCVRGDAPQCSYREVDTGLTSAFRNAGLTPAATHLTVQEWESWLGSSAHCVATDPTNTDDVTACNGVTELSDSTACLAATKADGASANCSYYPSGSTTAVSSATATTGTCTGTLDTAVEGTTDCSAIPTFVASSTEANCPTGCTFTSTNNDDNDDNDDNSSGSDPVNFKLNYSTEDSGLFTSVYNCDSATTTDSDKIICPSQKILDADAQTEGIFGGTFFSWLTGKPSTTTAKTTCCKSS